jgi:hypothetical protein
MSKDPKDQEFENIDEEDIKEELLETDLMMQEELSDEYENEIIETDPDMDIDEDQEVSNTINYDESESELDTWFKYGTNNHKLDGKHSLKRDTILNGRLNDDSDIIDEEHVGMPYMEFESYESGDIPIEKGSIFEEESRRGDEVQSKRRLAQDVYELLKENTDLDFRANRRKPNKTTFNNYYKMLLANIDKQYTKCDIFVELAYYFTDNIFNMYKLLDKKYATTIIKELREKGFLNNLNSIKFQ